MASVARSPYGRSPRTGASSPRSALAAIGIEAAPRRKRAADPVPLMDVDAADTCGSFGRSLTDDSRAVQRERSKSEVRPAPPGDQSGGRGGDPDRSRSRDLDVTLGVVGPVDSFDFSRDLAEVIDADRDLAERAAKQEAALRNEFRLAERELESEAIRHVEAQTQLVAHEASQQTDARREVLNGEWQVHCYQSRLAVEEVEEHSRGLVAEVEANVEDRYRMAAYQAVSQLEIAHSQRNAEMLTAYDRLERHTSDRDTAFRQELALYVEQQQVLRSEVGSETARAEILVERASLNADVGRSAERNRLQQRLVLFEGQQQQQQQQQRDQQQQQQQLLQRRLDESHLQIAHEHSIAASYGAEQAALAQQNHNMMFEIAELRRAEAVRGDEMEELRSLRDEMAAWKGTVQGAIRQIQSDADADVTELREELAAATTSRPDDVRSRGFSPDDARLIADLRRELAEATEERDEFGQAAWNYEVDCAHAERRSEELEEAEAEVLFELEQATAAAEEPTVGTAAARPSASFRISTPVRNVDVPQVHSAPFGDKSGGRGSGSEVRSALFGDRSGGRDGVSVLSNPLLTRAGLLPGRGVGLTMRSLLAPDAEREAERPRRQRRLDDLEDDYLSSDSDGAQKARSRKQVSPLTLDPIPQASGFREWCLTLNTRVIAASRRPRIATMRWLDEVQRATSLSQVEGVSAKWDDLDAELADCVLKISSGPLKRELVLYQEEQLRRGLPLGGRAA